MKAEASRNSSIFNPADSEREPHQLSVTYHNVGDMYRSLAQKIRNENDLRYGFRGGAVNWEARKVGRLVHEHSDEVLRHLDYVGASSGREITLYTMEDLKKVTGQADTLIVPYVNTTAAHSRIEDLRQDVFGLPPIMVDTLRNKVNLHELIRDIGIDGIETPEFEIATIGNIPEKANRILKESRKIYDDNGLTGKNKYPLGVVIRSEESDGGHGMCLVFEKDDGGIEVVTDGKTTEEGNFKPNEWTSAFKYAQNKLRGSTSKSHKTRFVVSRRIDVEDSPGMSLIIQNGIVESIGWNGQLIAEGTAACVGTSKYKPAHPYQERLQKQFENQSAEKVVEFTREVARRLNIPFDQITGVLNMDFMLPGPYETALRARRGQEEGFLVAECNARWTNYTDAVLQVVGYKKRIPSIRDIITTVWEDVHTIDSLNLKGADPEIVTEILFDMDGKEQGNDHAYVRMPVSPAAGFILTGNFEKALAKIYKAIERAKRPRTAPKNPYKRREK